MLWNVPCACLQTMDEPHLLSSAEKRRRTALAEKDYAAAVSAGGAQFPGDSGVQGFMS